MTYALAFRRSLASTRHIKDNNIFVIIKDNNICVIIKDNDIFVIGVRRSAEAPPPFRWTVPPCPYLCVRASVRAFVRSCVRACVRCVARGVPFAASRLSSVLLLASARSSKLLAAAASLACMAYRIARGVAYTWAQ